MAKRILYVCAGLLLLGAGYVAGTVPAGAQVANSQYFAGVGGASAALTGRTLCYMSPATGWMARQFPVQVPGSAAVVSVLVYNAGYDPPATTVVLEGGDVYHFNGTTWAMVGSYSGTTSSHLGSWGALKAGAR